MKKLLTLLLLMMNSKIGSMFVNPGQASAQKDGEEMRRSWRRILELEIK